MAMFLAMLRPAKKHLQGKCWDEVRKTVWQKDADGQYGFKKAHAISYSLACVVNMNLVSEGIDTQSFIDEDMSYANLFA
jgi:hypothetical protein